MVQSTDLAVYQKMDNPLVAVQQLGNSIAKSRIFGCSNVEAGQVMALECLTRGIPPLSLAERYDLIETGKKVSLSMKADAMLGDFISDSIGGKYKVVEYSPDASEIIFRRDGNEIAIRITWEAAQQEPWPWADKEQTKLKNTWATPIGRQDMLWARVVSRGVRRLAPEVVCGRYTPQEIDAFDSPVNGHHANGGTNGQSTTKPDDAIDAEYTVTNETETAVVGNEETTSTPNEKTDPAGNSPCTKEQRDELARLFAASGATPEQQQAILEKRNCSVIRNLTTEQAAELIIGLQSRISAQAESLTGTPAPESSNPMESRSVKAPASEVTVNEVKRLIVARQDQSLVDQLVAFLQQHGKQGVNQLSQRDAEALIIALTSADMEAFFTRSLESFGAEEPAKN